MRKLILSTLVIGTLGLSQSLAGTITITALNGYRTGLGGEFNVKFNDPTTNTAILANYDPKAIVNSGIETFCLEYTENFIPGSTYNYKISGGAISGGPGAVDGTDIISVGTAHLYALFATGSLAGYEYTPGAGRSNSAGLLQNTFWWLENEGSLAYNAANPFMKSVYDLFGGETNARADYTGASVKVINIGSEPLYPRQDQLVYLGVPDGGMTLALLGLGLAGLATIKRRFLA